MKDSSIKISFYFYGTIKTTCARDMTEAQTMISDLTDKANRACVWFAISGRNENDKPIWTPIGRNRFFSNKMLQLFQLEPDVGDEKITVATLQEGKKVVTSYTIRAFAEQDYREHKNSGRPVYMTKNGVVDKKDNCPNV